MGRHLNPAAKARLDGALVATFGDVENLTVPCVWCLATLDVPGGEMERDRREPGGTYTLDNVDPACRPCNAERQDATDGQWSDRYRMLPNIERRTDKATADRIRAERGRRLAADARAAEDRRAACRARVDGAA